MKKNKKNTSPDKSANTANTASPANSPAPASSPKPGRKNGELMNMLDSAFEEDISEISELSEMDSPPEEAPARKPSAFHFVLGLAVIVLSAIGLASTVGFVKIRIENIVENTDQKNEFAKFIYPVVICDPPPFDRPASLKNDTLITAAVWDIILFEDKSKYEMDFDYIIVPQVDVEQHAARLFGSGLSITHATIANADISFYYDEELSSYRIPENPKYFTYSPYIEEITRVGESYTLTVGYVSPTPAWLTLTSEDAPEPEKYAEYVVQKRGDSYTLVAVKSSDKVPSSGHDAGL
ncbi:MAG: hypothetical protein NC078_07105 [Ruminococcus sp.]|nr:hypothetical protein [Ruminococcus sp.]